MCSGHVDTGPVKVRRLTAAMATRAMCEGASATFGSSSLSLADVATERELPACERFIARQERKAGAIGSAEHTQISRVICGDSGHGQEVSVRLFRLGDRLLQSFPAPLLSSVQTPTPDAGERSVAAGCWPRFLTNFQAGLQGLAGAGIWRGRGPVGH